MMRYVRQVTAGVRDATGAADCKARSGDGYLSSLELMVTDGWRWRNEGNRKKGRNRSTSRLQSKCLSGSAV